MSEHPFISEVSASKLHAALVAIQELHKREEVSDIHGDHQVRCADCRQWYPCATRRLADQGLGDNLARTTKNGDNNE